MGPPWGFILGPLLFLLFMNDLLQFINNKSGPVLFADDKKTYCILIQTPLNLIQIFIQSETMNTWFKNDCISLN
jgi:hypothetical protein